MGSYTGKTILIDGMRSAKELIVFPQNPSSSGSKPVFRSVNKNDGIEFTWSVWIFIDNLTYNSGKHKCIFYKGNDNISNNGINEPNNAPGLYIAPDKNDLIILMNTFNVINEKITIPDIPMNKWVNLIIRCEGRKFDTYVNGTIARSMTLQGVPKQNYGSVYVGADGGFDGYISRLAYYNYALNINDIQALLSKGPNLSMDMLNLKSKDMSYLSFRWYL
jgi:hypothetical protein